MNLQNASPAVKPQAGDRRAKFEAAKRAWFRRMVLDHELTGNHFRVLVIIAEHMNFEYGGEAWCSVQEIAALTGLHRTTVMRATKFFEDRGCLNVAHSVIKGAKGWRHAPNRYSIPGLNLPGAKPWKGAMVVSKAGGKCDQVVAPRKRPNRLLSLKPINLKVYSNGQGPLHTQQQEIEEGKGWANGSEPINPVPTSDKPPSRKACYDFARRLDGEDGASMVAAAFERGASVGDVWDCLCLARVAGATVREAVTELWEFKHG
jgi:Helix-turn-helix domain